MERKILHGMRLEKPQNPTWNEAETQKFPTWNEAPGIQTSSDVVFPWWFLECRREFGGFVYSIRVSAKFGINLGKDSMLEWRNGFSFTVPVPYSDGSCGIGIVQVQRCSNSSIQIFQTSSLSSWSPFSRKKKPTKNGKKQGKKVSNGKFPLWNSALEGKCLGMVEEGGWTQNWEQILGLFLLLDPLWNSGFSEGVWIPSEIWDSLRAVGSPLEFWNP